MLEVAAQLLVEKNYPIFQRIRNIVRTIIGTRKYLREELISSSLRISPVRGSSNHWGVNVFVIDLIGYSTFNNCHLMHHVIL